MQGAMPGVKDSGAEPTSHAGPSTSLSAGATPPPPGDPTSALPPPSSAASSADPSSEPPQAPAPALPTLSLALSGLKRKAADMEAPPSPSLPLPDLGTSPLLSLAAQVAAAGGLPVPMPGALSAALASHPLASLAHLPTEAAQALVGQALAAPDGASGGPGPSALEREESAAARDSPEAGGGGAGGPRRPRLLWTQELHNRFINALSHLGLKQAVPKNILTMMNVEGMTRENVASHLQKYRLHLRKLGGHADRERVDADTLQRLHEEHVRALVMQQAMAATLTPAGVPFASAPAFGMPPVGVGGGEDGTEPGKEGQGAEAGEEDAAPGAASSNGEATRGAESPLDAEERASQATGAKEGAKAPEVGASGFNPGVEGVGDPSVGVANPALAGLGALGFPMLPPSLAGFGMLPGWPRMDGLVPGAGAGASAGATPEGGAGVPGVLPGLPPLGWWGLGLGQGVPPGVGMPPGLPYPPGLAQNLANLVAPLGGPGAPGVAEAAQAFAAPAREEESQADAGPEDEAGEDELHA